MKPKVMGRFTFYDSRARFVYLFLVLFAVLPAILLLAPGFSNAFWAFWIEQVDGPELQKEFGFTVGHVLVTATDGTERRIFAITSVSDNGVFAFAGVKTGDVPVGYVHGVVSGFYGDLLYARTGEPVDLQLVAVVDLEKGWNAARIVTIQLRKPITNTAR